MRVLRLPLLLLAAFVLLACGRPAAPVVSPARLDVTPTAALGLVPTRTATAIPSVTPTAEPSPLPYAEWPLCAEHDPAQWHSLVNEAEQCHYDHEHKADPSQLDDVFGPVGGFLPQTISYPWETSGENANKHRVYGWVTVRDVPCFSADEAYSFDALRAQFHFDGNAGATTRFHSYWLQARGCHEADPAHQAFIAIGGHADTGYLTAILTDDRLQRRRLPLPDDPPGPYDLRNDFQQKTHHAPLVRHDYGTWYGSAQVARETPTSNRRVGVQIAVRGEDWGPIDLADPYNDLFYGGAANGSWLRLQELRIILPTALDDDRDGYVNLDGHVDRHGYLVECDEVGPDCIPLVIRNMRAGVAYRINNADQGFPAPDYDVSPPGVPWITFPN